MATVRLIGPGRAGMSVASALAAAGHEIAGFVSSSDDPSEAASGVDVLILAVPDRRIAEVARRVRPVDTTVVLHLSGSQGLEVLAPHPRRGFDAPARADAHARGRSGQAVWLAPPSPWRGTRSPPSSL